MAAALFTSEQLYLTLFFFIVSLLVSALGLQNQLLSCESESPDASSAYHCSTSTSGLNGSSSSSLNQCATFAILRTNSYYSSLLNLSSYLGINRFVIAEANGFSAHTEFLPKDQPLLIPIDCKCSNGGLFQAQLTKTTIRGESFYGIAEALEGLTTCKDIREKNPGVSPWELADKVELHIPLRCACPSKSSQSRLLLSYPVKQGDTISSLAIQFNTTQEAIISANNRSTFRPESSLVPLTSLLIPLNAKPILGPLEKPREPNLRFPATSVPAISPHRKKAKMHKAGLYVAIIVVVVVASIAIAAALLVIQLRKKKQIISSKGVVDLELQQLSLSIRTTSDKKVSFEGSQDTLDGHTVEATTPRKVLVETYTMEELKRATEDFSSSNHIEGSVYHGRLSGNNLAIKPTQHDIISRIEFGLFHDAIHHHPNIMRLLGTCLTEGQDSFLVFEYAKNGSLKDWLHGGLAIKNQFIASCDCFLTWSQRLRICLDVAMALQYMHHIMNPSYVHRNVKSRNIFLDEEFNAKIGNFGMAKCVENDTENLAPEYVHQGVVSPSTDIFAYGIVLLEVLCGQKALTKPSEMGQGKHFWLSEKIKSILQSDNADELREWMDSALGENYSFDAALTLANLASACVNEDPCLRPSSGEVVEKLSQMVEYPAVEGENMLMSESSCKPLVKAAAASNMS
ncbi:PREDICTED: protein LYK2 [Fragaria vesca subsp. vesca]|uniref:protein LYK2 n=1 Tax=Fragaria vesca subsp. vesca TaxID=101020 RepID=UPI0002C3521E|nr:PREDICTED: protein LYK2 [Fragaria vesca subsp. vesca]